MPMTRWRRRRREDLRPTWEERHAALESLRERLRRQGAEERRVARVRRAAPAAALAAFALGAWAALPLLRAGEAASPELFAVRHLAVTGAARLDAADVARAAGLPPEGSAAVLAPAELSERLARHPWIAGARAARVSPDTVVVRIVERVPAAVWVHGPEHAWLVDAEGTAFAAADAPDLPRLHLAAGDVATCGTGRPCAPDPRLAAGVRLARAVERAGFARPEIELGGPEPGGPAGAARPEPAPVLRLAGVAPRVLLGGGDLERQLERLTRVLADVPASRGAAEIDLRFAGQVVLRPAGPPAEGVPPETGTGARSG